MKKEELFQKDMDMPYYCRRGEFVPRDPLRFKTKKPKPLRELGIKKLNPKQRHALQEFYTLAKDPKNKNRSLGSLKKEAADVAGYAPSSAPAVMSRLLNRKPIIDELDKAGVTDARIAEVIAEGLESEHPLRPGRPDPHAIIKFVVEANKIKDNHPATKLKISKESRSMVVHLTSGNIENFEKYQKLRGLNGPGNRD